MSGPQEFRENATKPADSGIDQHRDEVEERPLLIVDQILFVPPESLGGARIKGDIDLLQNQFLPMSYQLYRGKCECGVAYQNNCAHFLSDAMIRAGLPSSFPNAAAKCSAGRLIRAKELLDWFQAISTDFKQTHNGVTKGYWFIYQEDPSHQGHVCIHLESTAQYSYKGTGDFPSWPVQWHYYY